MHRGCAHVYICVCVDVRTVNNFAGCRREAKSSGKPIRNLTTTWIRYINIEKSVVSRMFTQARIDAHEYSFTRKCFLASILHTARCLTIGASKWTSEWTFGSCFYLTLSISREKSCCFFFSVHTPHHPSVTAICVSFHIFSLFLFLMFSRFSFIIIFLLFDLCFFFFATSSCLSSDISGAAGKKRECIVHTNGMMSWIHTHTHTHYRVIG